MRDGHADNTHVPMLATINISYPDNTSPLFGYATDFVLDTFPLKRQVKVNEDNLWLSPVFSVKENSLMVQTCHSSHARSVQVSPEKNTIFT